MTKSVIAALSATVLGLCAAPLHAQIRNVQSPPQGWFSVSVGRYLDMDRVPDAESESTWIFGESFTLGLGYHRDLGPGLKLGATVTGALPNYQLERDGGVREGGRRATLLTPMLTGRLNTGGAGGGLAFYLTGGAGAFIYRLPDLERWDPDLALFTGAGLDYAPGGARAFFLEWGRFWAYHQGDGVDSSRAFHSLIRLGARFGR